MLPHYSELHFADSRAFLEKVQPLFMSGFHFTGNLVESSLFKPIHFNNIRRLYAGKPCTREKRTREESSQFSPKQLQPSWQQS